MSLPKRFNPRTAEPRLQDLWQEQGTFHLLSQDEEQVYAIDTPPPTVSGKLHLGHVYSYSHADFLARFWRMRGRNVLYPMGFDDNGLPTERLVERSENIRAAEVGRKQFIEACLEVSENAEREYEALWRRLGLSIDWRYTYRTIDKKTRRLSQLSFIDLYQKGLAYKRKAPTIWCLECQTAIAQAELNDLERESEYITLEFKTEYWPALPVATTRPELLPACVALFVHPDDIRYEQIVGGFARVPLFEQRVPIKSDPEADPDKGTGIVMCCTFGDTTDVNWWYAHDLDLIEVIDKNGSLSQAAAEYAGLSVSKARSQIKRNLEERHLMIGREPTQQSVRVHERCDTPVEYIVATQWFIRVLEFKNQLLKAGEQVEWHPAHMQSRYKQWVENLGWDWCISRQRYFGVTFPVWYCSDCGDLVLAEKEQLPIDPAEREGFSSLHRSTWPEPDDKLIDDETEATGDNIVQIATAVRRFKSARNLSLATNLNDLYLITSNPNMSALLEEAKVDIISITRASRVTMTHEPVPGSESILSEEDFQVAVKL